MDESTKEVLKEVRAELRKAKKRLKEASKLDAELDKRTITLKHERTTLLRVLSSLKRAFDICHKLGGGLCPVCNSSLPEQLASLDKEMAEVSDQITQNDQEQAKAKESKCLAKAEAEVKELEEAVDLIKST